MRLYRSIIPFLVLASCASPAPTLYAIAQVDGTERQGGPAVVLVEQVSLERYLDRSQIVRSSETYRLDVRANDWWGEPLGAMIGRVLVGELGQRLRGSVVISDLGAISLTPDATVALNIVRLDEDATGTLVLRAQVGITRKTSPRPVIRDVALKVAPPAGGTVGEVAAISAALGQLADLIASLLARA